jgi:hypothetical protein
MRAWLGVLFLCGGCAGLGRPGVTYIGLDGGGAGPVTVECRVNYDGGPK